MSVERLRPLVLLGLLGLFPAAARAQVGHDPAHSPYRDLKWGQFVSVSAGKLFGAGGTLGIGPHDGDVLWFRHEFLADRPLSVSLGGGYAKANRNYVKLNLTEDRVKGPEERNLYFAEAGLTLNLTGTKTWHGLAPYAGMGLGLAFGEALPIDSTGYKFGTKFYLAPNAGIRVFLSRRLYVRAEARALFWSLRYPETYRTTDPDGFGPVLPLLAGGAIKEWSTTPSLHAGLGFAFRRPFF
ncbi:MAG: hypothetical protein AB7L66_09900 [Gemmatimonadales bacterium]